ncbi:MAG: hypothetical protein M3Q07_08310 [Pseudobdellovibrionaceae bacterium]|nr:hypothetical protein [Pseudobdellovibrionaceae bacterium]
MKFLIPALLGSTLLQGCMSVSSISISQIPAAAARKHKVISSASNLVLIAIPFGNSFVDRAREDLERQCPDGSIEGIQSKHQNTDYFLGLAVTQEVVMQGYCLSRRKKG